VVFADPPSESSLERTVWIFSLFLPITNHGPKQ